MGRRKKARTLAGLPGRLSLCWYCVNAVPCPETGAGCSWSRSYIPVKGWEAEERVVMTQRRGPLSVPVPSYRVRACPEFIKG